MRDMGLFRGKRKDNGKWIQGDLRRYRFDCRMTVIEDREERGREVDPETVGECTYLKDKTGKLIFEGDILSGHFDDEHPEDELKAIVEWNDMGWTICFPGRPGIGYEVLDPSYDGEWTVIGNIYDDPELLGGDE